MVEQIIQFNNFRDKIYNFFPKRKDTTMDLVDSIAANFYPASAAQVSLNPLFRREYSSLYDAVDNFFVASSPEKAMDERIEHQRELIEILAPLCPEPSERNFRLFAIDATSQPRQFAHTLEDRGFVYKPNAITGNKPVTIGHSYSVIVALPEKANEAAPPWVIPVSTMRIPTNEKATNIGSLQADMLFNGSFQDNLSVLLGDTAYSAVNFLSEMAVHEDLVTIVRVRGDRTFHRQPDTANLDGKVGHPTWFGSDFVMHDPSTWGTPDETKNTTFSTHKGRRCHVQIQGWHNILMNGKKDIPMHIHPFTLLRVSAKDDNGMEVFKNPIWLIIFGQRRHEISVLEAYEAYVQRFDIEHFFRFGKNKLLLDDYQTPIVEHEENWWEIVCLAYVMLWVAAPLSSNKFHPWARYLYSDQNQEGLLPSPSMVQRDMLRIISIFGTPACPPKPRGKALGRSKGHKREKRKRIPIVYKGGKSPPKKVALA